MKNNFADMKNKLASPPALSFLKFGKRFIVETNESAVVVRADLPQMERRKQPSHYVWKSHDEPERKYSSRKREYLAVILGQEKVQAYLLSSEPFTLVADHQALQYIFR